MKFLKLIFLIAPFFAYQTLSYARGVDDYFNSIKSDPNALYAFLKKMPKGGELHYHLAGGAYPEIMLALAAKGDFCLDKESLAMAPSTTVCEGIKSSDLEQNPSIYEQTVRAWSMKYFVAGEESGHDHFFASFGKFMPVLITYSPELLADVMTIAANQNEQYLEIMILPDNAKSTGFAQGPIEPEQFSVTKAKLLANKDFQANIEYTITESGRLLEKARESLGCDKAPLQEACRLTVKFQYYTLREQPLENLFAQAVNGFAAASLSKDIVAVNLVQPEDGLISLRDYHKQMEVFKFLHEQYPQVHISLHAGELAPSAVMPHDLRFHIQDAIMTGQAERIGHGVDIAYENNPEIILEEMKKRGTAVEINLISNKEILNISGKEHPLNYYLAHNIPLVLSTDDEGILRTDLTRQYVEAALNHQVDYPTLKMLSRNVLSYSFLPGKSLWADAEKAELISSCKDINSQSCLEFVKDSEKAELQRRLENKFIAFEADYRD